MHVHASQPQAVQPQTKAPTPKTDRDGDTDNSTPAGDAAETAKATALSATGVGQNVNRTA